jgi:hypothetical protein
MWAAKTRRLVLWIGGGLVLLVAGGLFGLYEAMQYVPEFYRQAVAGDPGSQEKASDEMLQQATALLSDVKKKGRWEAVFTAEQINGWLAVDLARNHPNLLPPSLDHPRVAMLPDQVMLACRFQWGSVSSVLSLTVEPYLAEPNVLALRIRKVRAGLLPLPLGGVLDRISEAAQHADLRLTWRRAAGDPVAIVSFGEAGHIDGKAPRLEEMQLSNGEIYVAGTTE